MEEKDLTKQKEKSKNNQDSNIWSWFFDFFKGKSGKNLHYKELILINKNMNKKGYPFYILKKQSFTSNFALLMYGIYNDIYCFRNFFLKQMDNRFYENSVLNYYNSDEEKKLVSLMLPVNIDRLSEKLNYEELSDGLKKAFTKFKANYSRERVMGINDLYRSVYILKQFSTFDYYALLKKFDNYLIEDKFNQKPNFSNVSKQNIDHEVIGFFELVFQFLTVKNWNIVANFFTQFNNDTLQFDKILKLSEQLKELKENNVFDDMAKLINEDFIYQIMIKPYVKDICVPYIDEIRLNINNKLEEIKDNRKNSFVKRHLEILFEKDDDLGLKNYCLENSEKFIVNGFKGYIWCEPLGYIRKFCKKYLENDIYKFMEILNARGKVYDVDEYSKLNIIYHDIGEQFQELLLFDKNLDENVSTGYKLNSCLSQLNTNPEVNETLYSELEFVNEKAEKIYNTSQFLFISFREQLNKYNEDKKNGSNELITNWDDLDHSFGSDSSLVMQNLLNLLNEMVGLLEICNE